MDFEIDAKFFTDWDFYQKCLNDNEEIKRCDNIYEVLLQVEDIVKGWMKIIEKVFSIFKKF